MLILNFLQSCNSQNIDLAKLNFPMSKEELIGEKSDFKKDQYVYALGLGDKYKNFVVYQFIGQPFLNYNAVKIDGKLSESKRYQNKVEFIADDEKNTIYGYELYTYTEKESISLIKEVNTYLGKPNYDDGESANRNIIWEVKNTIYYLNIDKEVVYNGIKTVGVTLKVINTSLVELAPYLTNPTYYEIYVKERDKKGKKVENYSYSLFVKDELKAGINYYSKGIKGLK